MPNYPNPPNWRFPVSRTITFDTEIITSDSGVEQRTSRSNGEETWSLPYSGLTLAQRDTLLTAFDTAKGQYASDITLTFGGVAFTGLAFDADELSASEDEEGWSLTVKLRKSVRVADQGVLGAFPTLEGGHVAQLPFTHTRSYGSVVVKTEGGRYSYSRHAYPNISWLVGGTCLTAADATAIWNHFLLARGRWATFTFRDPDDLTEYGSCRYAADELTLTYRGPGEHSITPVIQSLL